MAGCFSSRIDRSGEVQYSLKKSLPGSSFENLKFDEVLS